MNLHPIRNAPHPTRAGKNARSSEISHAYCNLSKLQIGLYSYANIYYIFKIYISTFSTHKHIWHSQSEFFAFILRNNFQSKKDQLLLLFWIENQNRIFLCVILRDFKTKFQQYPINNLIHHHVVLHN